MEEFRTSEDYQIDQESINPQHQIFEKMLSGMYLGEIVRKKIISVSEPGYIFSNRIPVKFMRKNLKLFIKNLVQLQASVDLCVAELHSIISTIKWPENVKEAEGISSYIKESSYENKTSIFYQSKMVLGNGPSLAACTE
ncbi:hypothetical protein MXB_293 [Myxobolus squamalis]|nr:hypothetical protein MXB_293 [Myxobolus squamalis]